MVQMVHFSIRLPRGLKADVARVAKAAGHHSTSKVIRDVLEKHFHGTAPSRDIAVARRVGAVVEWDKFLRAPAKKTKVRR